MTKIVIHKVRRWMLGRGERWKRYAVLQYEVIPGYGDVLAACRYFETRGGAEEYAAELERQQTAVNAEIVR